MIRLAPASSQVWRDRAATSLACRSSRPILPASDSNCCARLSLLSAGWRSWPMSAIPANVVEMGEVQAAARTLGLDAATSEIRRVEDIAPAFEALKGRADALYVCADPLMNTNRVRINTLALGARLPTMHTVREYVEAGGLMSYGPNLPDLFRRAAEYRRQDSARDEARRHPGRAAYQIRPRHQSHDRQRRSASTVPPTLLARADEVIE